MKRGVSFYSYQQTQFFKELDLEGQIREVSQNLPGADGVELIDEMSLRYPDPGPEFTRQWFSWMEQYGTVPVTLDVGMDTLQFRDHVMTIDECADRLRHDIRLARTLGFSNVRVLSVCPLEVMTAALPLAEQLDIRLGREIHQPMTLEGRQVTEVVEYAEKVGTRHLGLVPDFGIFQFRPSEVQLAWFERRGARPEASAAAVELALAMREGQAGFDFVDLSFATAGNLRADYRRFLASGDTVPQFVDAFEGVRKFTHSRVQNPQEIDFVVVAEALMLSNTSTETMRQLAGHVVSCHGKFNNMSPVEDRPGEFTEQSIDYAGAIGALAAGGFTGYVNTEYEGQRYFQDGTRGDLQDEVEQVRRHQDMLRRLIEA